MKNAELIVAHKPKSSVAEAIKTIRTNLQFSAVNGDVKSILVTSSMPGEGKSFVASNLAVAFAQAGSKVLIEIVICEEEDFMKFLMLIMIKVYLYF